jgi:hypothetical protein
MVVQNFQCCKDKRQQHLTGETPAAFCLAVQQVRTPAAAAGSSRQSAAANQGAWAPWMCAAVRQDTASGQLRTAAAATQRHVDPRHFRSHGALRLQLGQPVTLHFVAVDFLGCPAVLTKLQRRHLVDNGLQLRPASGKCIYQSVWCHAPVLHH